MVIEAGDKLPIAFDFRPQLFKLPGIEFEEMTYRYFIVRQTGVSVFSIRSNARTALELLPMLAANLAVLQ